MQEYPIHPYAKIFPINEEDYQSIKNDIRDNGFDESFPIILLNGEILDGRTRYQICQELGVEPAFKELPAGKDPLKFVAQANANRRHLTPAQRAMAAAKIRDIFDEQAKERLKVRKGNQPGATLESFPELQKGTARDMAAQAVGSKNGKYVDMATKILHKAVPEVVEAVEKGRMSIKSGVNLIDKPQEVQREAAAQAKFTGGRYRGQNGKNKPKPPPAEKLPEGENPERSKAVKFATTAINCLQKVGKKNPFRKLAFKMVADFIKNNS